MKALTRIAPTLVLQVPGGPGSHRALVIASTDSPTAIRAYCGQLLADADAAIESAGDFFTKQYYSVQRDQLRARLSFVLGETFE
jgi:hypothetical protein